MKRVLLSAVGLSAALLFVPVASGVKSPFTTSQAQAEEMVIRVEHHYFGGFYDTPYVKMPTDDPAYNMPLDMRTPGASLRRLELLDKWSTDATCTINCRRANQGSPY